jgi:hypothetical protein
MKCISYENLVGNGFLTTVKEVRFSRYISYEIFGRNGHFTVELTFIAGDRFFLLIKKQFLRNFLRNFGRNGICQNFQPLSNGYIEPIYISSSNILSSYISHFLHQFLLKFLFLKIYSSIFLHLFLIRLL